MRLGVELLELAAHDLVDGERAAAAAASGRAGAGDGPAATGAVADRVADRAIGDGLTVADDHARAPRCEGEPILAP